MGWTLPTSWTAGHVVTGTELNTHLRDDMRYLKGLDGTVTFSDGIDLGTNELTVASATVIGTDGKVVKGQVQNHSHTGTGECGTVHHGDLIGLTDDDHTQYVLRSLATATGDIVFKGTAVWERLPIGNTLDALKVVGGKPAWGAQALTYHELNYAAVTAGTVWATCDLGTWIPVGGLYASVIIMDENVGTFAASVGLRKNGSTADRQITYAHEPIGFTDTVEVDGDRKIQNISYSVNLKMWLNGYWS